MSKSTVSRICKTIGDDVAVLRTRRLDHQPFIYVWLDATYVHVRDHGQVVSRAVVTILASSRPATSSSYVLAANRRLRALQLDPPALRRALPANEETQTHP